MMKNIFKINAFRSQLIICLIGFFVVCQMSLSGQVQKVKTKAINTSTRALSMAESGDWDGAIKLLDKEVRSFKVQNFKAGYISYLHFNLGYLYEQRPDGEGQEFLIRAVEQYKEALTYQPNDVKIYTNLMNVYLALNQHENALACIKRVIETKPENEHEWWTRLGDTYNKMGSTQSAWSAYERAEKSSPNSRAASQKLLNMYARQKEVGVAQMYEKCLKYRENEDDELSKIGLQKIITSYCNESSAYGEKVMLLWAAIVAQNHWLDKVTVSWVLGLECNGAAVQELQHLLAGDIEKWNSGSWWTTSEQRHFYKVALQKTLAEGLLAKGQKKEAMQLLDQSNKELSSLQDFSEEIYGRPDVLEMEILIDLARLFADKDLDPNGENFNRLENLLFRQKGQSYRSNDLQSIQKFHTILGLIYVDREKWTGGTYTNAIFQLKSAIKTSEKRNKENPAFYQPLPRLKAHLAQAYQKAGNYDLAANTYLDASLAYLETDHLKECEKSLSRVKRLTGAYPNSKLAVKTKEVNLICQARKSISTLPSSSFEKGSSYYFEKNEMYEWINNPGALTTIDDKIVARQAFKTSSDLLTRAGTFGNRAAVQTLKSVASQKAAKVTVAASREDQLRISKINAKRATAIDNQITNRDFDKNIYRNSNLKKGNG